MLMPGSADIFKMINRDELSHVRLYQKLIPEAMPVSYLANSRLRAIGLEPLYKEAKYSKSPYTHLERFSDTKKEAHTKANFFEATVTSYVMSSGITGWDEI